MKYGQQIILGVFGVCFFALCASAEVNPVKTLFYSATQAFAAQEFERAISLYEKVIELNPTFALAHYYLGLVHRETNTDLKTIAGIFERAIELDPRMAPAHDSLARVYYALGRYDDAYREAETALSIDPQLVSAQLSMGWICLLGKSQPRDAIMHFSKVAAEQDLAYAHFGLGLAYFIDGERFKVLEMITNLRRLGEDSFAEHLEKMIRENKYFAPIEHGKPLLLLPQQKISVAGFDDAVPFDDEGALEETPVRLLTTLPGRSSPVISENDALPAADRIRELRERGRSIASPQPIEEE